MKTILITGANRGLGLEFVRQLAQDETTIIACCRNPQEADELSAYAEEKKNIVMEALDVRDDQQISNLVKKLHNQPIDWLINNAGITGDTGVTVGNVDRDNFLNVINTNCLSPLKISEAFLKNIEQSQDKLIVCISSQMGSIKDNVSGRSYAYRTGKAALNCAMRSFAIDVENQGVKVMLLHPGWVKTDMGGEDALIDPQTSIAGMLKVIHQHKDNSHAEVLRSYNGDLLPW